MARLVTLAEAKEHLRYTGTDHDADVQAKLDQAESLVLDYIGSTQHWRDIAADWLPGTVPQVVQAAILVQTAEFDRFRGDDQDGQGPVRDGDDDLSPQVRELLRRTRDPVLS